MKPFKARKDAYQAAQEINQELGGGWEVKTRKHRQGGAIAPGFQWYLMFDSGPAVGKCVITRTNPKGFYSVELWVAGCPVVSKKAKREDLRTTIRRALFRLEQVADTAKRATCTFRVNLFG